MRSSEHGRVFFQQFGLTFKANIKIFTEKEDLDQKKFHNLSQISPQLKGRLKMDWTQNRSCLVEPGGLGRSRGLAELVDSVSHDAGVVLPGR